MTLQGDKNLLNIRRDCEKVLNSGWLRPRCSYTTHQWIWIHFWGDVRAPQTSNLSAAAQTESRGCSQKYRHQRHLFYPTITATCSPIVHPGPKENTVYCSRGAVYSSISFDHIHFCNQQKRIVVIQGKERNNKTGIYSRLGIKEVSCLEVSELNTICVPDMQSKPIWKPKLMKEASKYSQSAETYKIKLETRYHRKPRDEFTGWQWPTVGGGGEGFGQQLEERLSHIAPSFSIPALVFINTHIYIHACTHAKIVTLMQIQVISY